MISPQTGDFSMRKDVGASGARGISSDPAFLEHLIASTPGIVFRVDAREWRTTYISPSVEHILGYGVEEVLADPDFWTNRVHPDDAVLLRRRLAAVATERPESLVIEASFRHASGGYRRLQLVMRCRYEGGAPSELIGSISDVTEWRAAVAALREAEHAAVTMAKRMRAVADAVSGLVMADSLLELQNVLRGACSQVIAFDVFTFGLYDATAGTLSFLPTGDAGIHDDGETISVAGTASEMVIATRRSLWAGTTGHPGLTELTPFGTGRRSESLIHTPVTAGNDVLAVISVQSYAPDLYDEQDVEVMETLAASAATALRMLFTAERRQRAEQDRERLVSILEAAPDLIGIFAPDGRLLYINRGGHALLGLTTGAPGEQLSAFLTDRAWEQLMKESLPAVVEHGTWSGETTLRARNGREIPVLQHIVAHRDGDGVLEYLSTIARDLTAYKQLEHELIQSQKMEAVGRLAGGIAHDFNNLMTAILGHVAFLLDGVDPDSRLRDDAMQIRRAAESATSLTRQLLTFGRKQVIRPERIAVNEVIREMTMMVERLLGDQVSVIVELGDDAGCVLADRLQLQQVVLNLVMNARDAMDAGGTLRIQTRRVTDDDDVVRRFAGLVGDHTLLCVRDDGHGMDEATLARIWEPFFTTKDPARGTGLGLPTVYGIVQESGGSIAVDSVPGGGTTVHVLLPRATGEAVPASPVEAEGSYSGGGTILLAEDDPAVRRVATQILLRAGYSVLESESGEDALRAYAAAGRPIDLLLTDVVMPGMGGAALAQRMAELQPTVPVLFTSGYTEDEAIRHGVLTSGIHFVGKPFSPAALLQRVCEAISRRAAGSDLPAQPTPPARHPA